MEVLLSSARGMDKEPGELRKTQNWIDPRGNSLTNAKFIPPNISDMMDALTNFESYIHLEDKVNRLVKIALFHYQFEIIHPFLDGNGRVVRLLISILLKHYGQLENDTLYFSYYLKKNRVKYYDRLMYVRLKDHYESWVTFLLKVLSDLKNMRLEHLNRYLNYES